MNHPILADIMTSACSAAASAAIVLNSGAAVVLAAPHNTDVASVFGASVAASLVFAEARKKDRDLLNLCITIIVSVGFGVIGPGVFAAISLAKGWITPEQLETVTWHAWAFAGLIFSLVGWTASLSTYSLIADKIPAWIARRTEFLDK